jgi:hypothetical protein
MLKDIIKKIDSAIPSLFPVNPEKFNDPVALQTEWKGVKVKSGGASTALVQMDENRLVYKPSIAGYVMGVIFIIAGIFISWLYFFMSGDKPWFLLLTGVIFALSGVFIFIQASTPIVFDKSTRMFYKGRKQPKIPDTTDSKHTVSFNDIHAIQLLTRLESSSSVDNSGNQSRRTRYYRVYEMNLVKHDGKRKYVNTFGKDDLARHDANIIADFIGVPVWDGIDG